MYFLIKNRCLFFIYLFVYFYLELNSVSYIFVGLSNSYKKHWILTLLLKEKVKSLHVLLFFLSERRNVLRLLLLPFLLIAVDKDREINYLVRYSFLLVAFLISFYNYNVYC